MYLYFSLFVLLKIHSSITIFWFFLKDFLSMAKSCFYIVWNNWFLRQNNINCNTTRIVEKILSLTTIFGFSVFRPLKITEKINITLFSANPPIFFFLDFVVFFFRSLDYLHKMRLTRELSLLFLSCLTLMITCHYCANLKKYGRAFKIFLALTLLTQPVVWALIQRCMNVRWT